VSEHHHEVLLEGVDSVLHRESVLRLALRFELSLLGLELCDRLLDPPPVAGSGLWGPKRIEDLEKGLCVLLGVGALLQLREITLGLPALLGVADPRERNQDEA